MDLEANQNIRACLVICLEWTFIVDIRYIKLVSRAVYTNMSPWLAAMFRWFSILQKLPGVASRIAGDWLFKAAEMGFQHGPT